MKTWDVVVAGAGPAGAAIAHSLARHGARVAIVAPVQGCRLKIGESLPGAGVALLRALELPVPQHGGPHATIRGNSSSWGTPELQHLDFIYDFHGPGWRLDRSRFDADLCNAATESGAARIQSRVKAITRAGDWWTIECDRDQVLAARWLVDATGRTAAVARRLGVRRHRDQALVAIYAVSQPLRNRGLDRTMIESVSSGWWYAAWLPTGVAIAVLHVAPDEAARLKRTAERWRRAYARASHISAMLANVDLGMQLHATDASGARLERFAGDGWLACGDAALSFDPISAQGLYFAFYSAKHAAQAVFSASGGANTEGYVREIEAYRAAYSSRLLSVYRSEQRWRESPFWAVRHISGL